MADPALVVEQLAKSYEGRAVLAGVSLSARRGGILALLGPNGAGKTTTVQICQGLRRADSGRVEVLGHGPGDRRVRARVGVMPQAGGAYPGLRAGEMLRLVAAFHRHPLDPELLLERLGLRDVARTPCRKLSGGQQQRLSLALALVGRPELVFLDEPTAGLDPQGRQQTWEAIRALRRDGVTVLLTTHLLDEAERLADQVVVLHRGAVVGAGTVTELTAGGPPEVRFEAPPGLDLSGLTAALPAGSQVAATGAGSYLVSGPAELNALLAGVTTWCAEHNVPLAGLRTGTRSLEDVFLELTGGTT